MDGSYNSACVSESVRVCACMHCISMEVSMTLISILTGHILVTLDKQT